jgi:hypothetical protein
VPPGLGEACPIALPPPNAKPPPPLPAGTTYKGQVAAAAAPAKAAVPMPPKKAVVKPERPMRSLFWNKIHDMKIHTTVWKILSDEDVELDVAKLVEQFQKAAPAEKKVVEDDGHDEAGEKKPVKAITLLDPKRQQNVGIALARYKLSTRAIKSAVMAMDFDFEQLAAAHLKAVQLALAADEPEPPKPNLGNKIDKEKLDSLLALAPTDDEMETLRGYAGTLLLLNLLPHCCCYATAPTRLLLP